MKFIDHKTKILTRVLNVINHHSIFVQNNVSYKNLKPNNFNQEYYQ